MPVYESLPAVEIDSKEYELGRRLFFDPLLSRDGSRSCAHCHRPDHGFTDGEATSLGIGNKRLKRSSPSLWNIAFAQVLNWDGRHKNLESQVQGPLFSPDEMAADPAQIVERLKKHPEYSFLFRQAFARAPDVEGVLFALVSFEKSLISLTSRYDRYVAGDEAALTETEKQGYAVFRSFVTRCVECHTPPLFTNYQLAVIGVPDFLSWSADPGAGSVSHELRLKGAFRIPTLRNISKTAPYMHAGNFSSLEEVIDFYNKGGGRDTSYKHWHIRQMGISNTEVVALIAFLKTLDDESLMPRASDFGCLLPRRCEAKPKQSFFEEKRLLRLSGSQ